MQLQKTLLPVAIIGGFSLVAMAVADIGPFSSLRSTTQTVQSFSSVVATGAAPAKLTFPASQSGPDGQRVVTSPNVRVAVNSLVADRSYVVSVIASGRKVGDFSVSGSSDEATLDFSRFENGPEIDVLARAIEKNNSAFHTESSPVKLLIDSEGPRISTVRLESNEDSGSKLRISFLKHDLDTTTAQTSPDQKFAVNRVEATGQKESVSVSAATATASDATLTLEGTLESGQYEVEVLAGVRDWYGNPAGQERYGEKPTKQSRRFGVLGAAVTGPAIAFPEFTPRPPASEVSFNPGDRVETRVVRLYYNRDARRVAQIVNRNIRSYNQARVNARQFQADGARSLSDVSRATLDRRERDGIAAAQQVRRLDEIVQAARTDLIQLQQRSDRVLTIQRELNQLAPVAQNTTLENASLRNATISSATIQSGTLTEADIQGGNTPANNIRTFSSAQPGQIITAMIGSGTLSGTARISGTLTNGSQGVISAGTLTAAATISGRITGGNIVTGQITDGNAVGRLEGVTIADATVTGATISDVTLGTATGDQDRVNELRAQLAGLTGSTVVNNNTGLTAMQDDVTRAQNAFNKARADRDAAQQAVDTAKQQIARAEINSQIANRNKFEAEVAARTEDPDSYAPANIESIDRVMQVSISVIGEGLIQLRGPIRGINEIRKMINQMDAPVGQVKVGVFTVQVNGEHGDQMDDVASDIEAHIDLSRTLTNRSLQLIRRAVAEVAGRVVEKVDAQYPGHRQVDRDRKYVYAFFGRDFIDELLAMDSEFLRTQNKLLSLHSMDTVGLSQALFVLALAKNDVRQEILAVFNANAQQTLADEEFKFRRARNLWPKGLKKSNKIQRLFGYGPLERYRKGTKDKLTEAQLQFVCSKSAEWNRFANFNGFFTLEVSSSKSMNPLQREFIRLAQIFKSQLVAEFEVKQRVIERGLIQDNQGDLQSLRDQWMREHLAAKETLRIKTRAKEKAIAEVNSLLKGLLTKKIMKVVREYDGIQERIDELGWNDLIKVAAPSGFENRITSSPQGIPATILKHQDRRSDHKSSYTVDFVKTRESNCPEGSEYSIYISPDSEDDWKVRYRAAHDLATHMKNTFEEEIEFVGVEKARFKHQLGFLKKVSDDPMCFDNVVKVAKLLFHFRALNEHVSLEVNKLSNETQELSSLLAQPRVDARQVQEKFEGIRFQILQYTKDELKRDATNTLNDVEKKLNQLREAETELLIAQRVERVSLVELDHRKLLDFLTDEQEEKYIELVEGTRSHISNVDNYLKRLAIALEDDFKIQFYDPAFRGVREAGRREAVNLGQIERTTILTNNRQFAKVSPQATMEFDLPRRAPVIVEAMTGAKALMQDLGDTVNDPAFIGLTAALSGAPAVGGAGKGSLPGVQPVFPTLGTDNQPTYLSSSSSDPAGAGREKTNLEKLIPDPAIYKFQTGTGFEIRPVIQPDGHSIIYNFNYLYTTNVREPVNPDEKHLGRVKQHYINTEVQTTSYELREISRYQVALRASRTGRGVPLLEEIPVAGQLFQPAASDESSLQQNIILGQTTVYPTLFDLMGLRWSRHIADLNHISLREQEHVVRGRNQVISDVVFDRSAQYVDDVLDIERQHPEHYRKDLHRPQRQPSPYHPGGYIFPDAERDPTGRDYYRGDSRPEEIRNESPFDEYRGGPVEYYREGRERLNAPTEPRPEVIRQSPYDRPQTLFPPKTGTTERERISLPAPAPGASERIRQMSFEKPQNLQSAPTLREPEWSDDEPVETRPTRSAPGPTKSVQETKSKSWGAKVRRAFGRK